MAVAKLLFVFLLALLVGRVSLGQAQVPKSALINKGSPASRAVPDLKARPAPRTQSQEGAPVPQKPNSDKAKNPGNDDGTGNEFTVTWRNLLLIPGALGLAGSLIPQPQNRLQRLWSNQGISRK